MPDAVAGTVKRPAPVGLGKVVAALTVVCVITTFFASAGALSIAPIFDLTPIVAIVSAWLFIRWDGAVKWLLVSTIGLGALMLVWWAVWWGYAWHVIAVNVGLMQPQPGWVNTLTLAYPAAQLAMLVLLPVALGLSARRIRRAAAAQPAR